MGDGAIGDTTETASESWDGARELASSGYRRTESECRTDGCTGTYWYHENTLVCDSCSGTIDIDQNRREQVLDDKWREFWRERPCYHQSNRVKMIGGFLAPYEWVSSSDVDGAVGDLASHEFYR